MEDVWGEIFSHLDPIDLSRCERVNKEFYCRARNAWSREKVLDTLHKRFQCVDETAIGALLDRTGERMDLIRLGRPSTSQLYTSNFRSSQLEIPSNLHFTGSHARKISQLYRLKRLRFHRMIITLNALEEMQNFPASLEDLTFFACRFEVFSLEEAELAENSMIRLLEKCVKLKTFRIETRWCGWLKASRKLIAALPRSLSELHLNLGDAPELNNLDFIRSMNLTTLGVAQNVFQANALSTLLSMKCLKSLDLSNSRLIDDFTALGQIDSLRELNLSGCYSLFNRSFETICMGCPRLIHLNIDACFRLTRLSLEKIAFLFNLECLSLSGIPAVNDSILVHISGLAHIATLDLSKCPGITSLGVEWSLNSLPSLQFISLRGSSPSAQKCVTPIGSGIFVERDPLPVQFPTPPPAPTSWPPSTVMISS
ncbi:unnamed protein product, partial [Mesorhabditis belari]|uniref:F-box domain-containing protein n=1 Tax=Mesorhabditis belari TaxID=2138241 RepID=A0AAF3JAG1_9BILA